MENHAPIELGYSNSGRLGVMLKTEQKNSIPFQNIKLVSRIGKRRKLFGNYSTQLVSHSKVNSTPSNSSPTSFSRDSSIPRSTQNDFTSNTYNLNENNVNIHNNHNEINNNNNNNDNNEHTNNNTNNNEYTNNNNNINNNNINYNNNTNINKNKNNINNNKINNNNANNITNSNNNNNNNNNNNTTNNNKNNTENDDEKYNNNNYQHHYHHKHNNKNNNNNTMHYQYNGSTNYGETYENGYNTNSFFYSEYDTSKQYYSADTTTYDFSELSSESRDGEYIDNCGILDVWSEDVRPVLREIERIVKRYEIIAIDTEFPGTCIDVIGLENNPQTVEFHNMRFNVNTTKLIQLGMSFSDSNGARPEPYHTFQFNFAFDVDVDIINNASFRLLVDSGIDFERLKTDGISQSLFSELLIDHRLICNESLTWISYHGAIDFAYIVKLLIIDDISSQSDKFFDALRFVFPILYDVKTLAGRINTLTGGLSKLASLLKIARVGAKHQGGSDSMLALDVFLAINRYCFLPGEPDAIVIYNQRLYGFETLSRPPLFAVDSLLRSRNTLAVLPATVLPVNMATSVTQRERVNVACIEHAKVFPDCNTCDADIPIVEARSVKSLLKRIPAAAVVERALKPYTKTMVRNAITVLQRKERRVQNQETNPPTASLYRMTKLFRRDLIFFADIRFYKFIDRKLTKSLPIYTNYVPIDLFHAYSDTGKSSDGILINIIQDIIKVRHGEAGSSFNYHEIDRSREDEPERKPKQQ